MAMPIFAKLARRWCFTSKCFWWRLETGDCSALDGLPLSKGGRNDALTVLREVNAIRQADGLTIVYARGV